MTELASDRLLKDCLKKGMRNEQRRLETEVHTMTLGDLVSQFERIFNVIKFWSEHWPEDGFEEMLKLMEIATIQRRREGIIINVVVRGIDDVD